MTRIIAGRAAGAILEVPDAGTRPTSDRVRESLFAALESAGAFDDARVLDLYAGSGALGLESASRGAVHVDLVELAGAAAKVAERNLAKVAKALDASSGRVHRASADSFLGRSRDAYDLVFLDPPYDLDDPALAATLTLLAPRLAPDAFVIVERSRRSPEPSWPDPLVRVRDRVYGDTTMWWAQPRPASQSR